jgi:hypothetical protein
MKIHVHDNNDIPKNQNCLGEFELEPGFNLTLHMHRGDCRPCPQGHCHQAVIGLLEVKGELFLVFEGVMAPTKTSLDKLPPHSTVTHWKEGEMTPSLLNKAIRAGEFFYVRNPRKPHGHLHHLVVKKAKTVTKDRKRLVKVQTDFGWHFADKVRRAGSFDWIELDGEGVMTR